MGDLRSAYWKEYKSKIETKNLDHEKVTRFPLDASFQGVNRLFNDNQVERNCHIKYFLPRVDITNYNGLIDDKNFYNQPINDLIKHYDEVIRVLTGKGSDYTAGCLLHYRYFKNHYKIITIDPKRTTCRSTTYTTN